MFNKFRSYGPGHSDILLIFASLLKSYYTVPWMRMKLVTDLNMHVVLYVKGGSSSLTNFARVLALDT